MNINHYATRFKQLQLLADSSTCIRRGVAAMVIDEETNHPLVDGYNGTMPGDSNTCSNIHGKCDRTIFNVPSGTRYDIGCYHAERSCIYRAAEFGIALNGKTMLITEVPCLDCAKAIARVGIKKVIHRNSDWIDAEGPKYLISKNIEVCDLQTIIGNIK